MNEGNPGSGPQENVPQEQVQSNTTWDTGSEKTPSSAQTDAYWNEAGDSQAEAGAATALTADPLPADESLTGAQDRNPTTYGGMGQGRPASGATTHPDKTAGGDESV